MSMARPEALGDFEQETLITWFTRRMRPEDRRELMGQFPVMYHKLFPGVDPAILHASVDRELRKAGVPTPGFSGCGPDAWDEPDFTGPDDRTDYDYPAARAWARGRLAEENYDGEPPF